MSQLPHGIKTLLFALSSEAFAVSFFVVTWYVVPSGIPSVDDNWCFLSLVILSNTSPPPPCSLAMFYVIALAGAHKRVINQLREQLAMVGVCKTKSSLIYLVQFSIFTLLIIRH